MARFNAFGKDRGKCPGAKDLAKAGFVQVLVPGLRGGLDRLFVRLLKGTEFAGTGTIMEAPKRSKFKFGQVIKFTGGSELVLPKFESRVHVANKAGDLREELRQELLSAMLFNPKAAAK